MIKIDNINKHYGKNHVLKNTNLDILSDKVTILSGPNGSGKTTLVKLILGIVFPDNGAIYLDGENINAGVHYKNKIGYMPQMPNFPENLSGNEILNICKKLRNSEVDFTEYIEHLRLENHINKPFKTLSGGNKQKINLIQAFGFDSDYLILDEPTVSLDPVSRLSLKELIIKKKNEGKSILIITHILSEIIDIADKLIYLVEGNTLFDGEIHELNSITQSENYDIAISQLTHQYERNI
ncbi:MAG: copper ABC transporter ATP-binding protein [Ignavibacteriae bacterium HGW-Ignavibacteriae-1]|jgi:Cu-processing system ATP-binding protein|nr:MAG: copper ABC transporter ATP-binding protein [Ignavibacteriae bacterium HGW-Ignavibacteriae-1]